MPPPLTRQQLDAAGCGTPNCGHDHSVIYLVSGCHPASGVEVRFNKPRGLLEVRCKRCEKPVADVKVAQA
jgi:hypothetical protein